MTTVNGVTTCACQPDSLPCTATTECCAGVCTDGLCVSNPGPCLRGQRLCPDGVCRTCCPDCTGSICGDDGCGGSCGVCDCGSACCSGTCCPPGVSRNQICDTNGDCCEPVCEAVACGAGGPETCGFASCGTCSGGAVCVNGACRTVCTSTPCPTGCDNCFVGPSGNRICASNSLSSGTGTCRTDADCCPGETCAANGDTFDGRFVCYILVFAGCTT